MKDFIKLNKKDKLNIFNQTSERTGLPSSAVEKDWWVTLSLNIIFSLPYANHIVFKGGTSLSKAWDLIERFSEDIDLVIDRKHLGFEGKLSKTQVKKLRKASYSFIGTEFYNDINNELINLGVSDYELVVQETKNTDTDPLIIELRYKSLTEKSDYLRPRVLIEVGARSLIEPVDEKSIISMVSSEFRKLPFAEKEITIPVVSPKRTFLEKIFLLHEEFQKETKFIRVERMSRHFYDLEKLMDTAHGVEALKDIELYNTIVEHRKNFNAIRGIDYANHIPKLINIIPPEETIKDWKKDYKTMQESMFYGTTISFGKLMERITELNTRIKTM
ncbi:nucleotidyl transferase AbiEii/AbiGii toxin family protein [Tenacibaculum finnmarkense]|uniref:nucleotidyl transferase AbiEii/AbiGii toxin family protein n=1 Tax=Tenacibaculum finnmarkense TaxID=2781243 RepID=UPI00187B6EE9|nr:nucleotidyl transferase AbiEii/AbiGii toxin family protein [Tenacibaculum finnmarkense]MBE7659362.1 nucleotidyl transferase AbiEii/AbiGii toxin family protein [Tenacibaculum finnmarkense genomovar finnmarkense]MCG8251454.1 nucleotidyl transferase AbiEii/AbiGii toxin family protein [Tenacibaculum finnmarkense genomovar finnmarkense]MCG8814962.1 nucleotidyl transferase AbiEii/AbiGii toxin family protein [Tenacibaculum finnmarkense]MCG8820006.1 nucleotidyl transferase AbiEii/AbiGii toxin family